MNAVEVTCPACFARPGRPCTRPTDTTRVPVSWFHFARVPHAADEDREDRKD